jgi:hypothetical protein
MSTYTALRHIDAALESLDRSGYGKKKPKAKKKKTTHAKKKAVRKTVAKRPVVKKKTTHAKKKAVRKTAAKKPATKKKATKKRRAKVSKVARARVKRLAAWQKAVKREESARRAYEKTASRPVRIRPTRRTFRPGPSSSYAVVPYFPRKKRLTSVGTHLRKVPGRSRRVRVRAHRRTVH